MKKNKEIINNLLYKLLESKLFELALKRKEAINKIKSYDDTLAEHIIKCFVLKYSIHRSHWLKEINNYIFNIAKIDLDQKHTKFTKELYLEFLWKPSLETIRSIERYLEWIADEYPSEPIKNINAANLHSAIKKLYLEKICKPISEDKYFRLKLEDFNIN